jgi:hypothetical protein
MSTTRLKYLVPVMLVLFGGSYLTRNDNHGFWGVISAITWFGLLLSALAVIVLLAAAGVRRLRRNTATN